MWNYCKPYLVTDGSTGDELDSDGDLSTGIIRKKSSKKSRTRSKYKYLYADSCSKGKIYVKYY